MPTKQQEAALARMKATRDRYANSSNPNKETLKKMDKIILRAESQMQTQSSTLKRAQSLSSGLNASNMPPRLKATEALQRRKTSPSPALNAYLETMKKKEFDQLNEFQTAERLLALNQKRITDGTNPAPTNSYMDKLKENVRDKFNALPDWLRKDIINLRQGKSPFDVNETTPSNKTKRNSLS